MYMFMYILHSSEFLVDTNMVYLVFSLVVGRNPSCLVNTLMWEYATCTSNNHSVDCTHVQKQFQLPFSFMMPSLCWPITCTCTSSKPLLIEPIFMLKSPMSVVASLFFILLSALCNRFVGSYHSTMFSFIFSFSNFENC